MNQENKPETVEQAAIKYSGSRQDIFDCFVAGANWQASQHSYTEQKWISVDLEADVKDTDLQHFEQYFIVVAETGKITQASFLDWETEGVDNTWIIGDAEFPLSFASDYQRVIYPKPPTQHKGITIRDTPSTYTQEQMIAFGEAKYNEAIKEAIMFLDPETPEHEYIYYALKSLEKTI